MDNIKVTDNSEKVQKRFRMSCFILRTIVFIGFLILLVYCRDIQIVLLS